MKKKPAIKEQGTLKPYRTDWGVHFYPNVITHQRSYIRKKHSDYISAKAGDIYAAIRFANDMLSSTAIEHLIKIVSNREVILLPVSSLESSGVNMIPRAFAIMLSKYLNCEVDDSIYQINYAERTGKDPLYRIRHQPIFDGRVKKNQCYILVDDHSSMGATFANLKGHIETNGGRVVAATSISARIEGLALDYKAINRSKQKLQVKHYEKTISRALKQEMKYECNYKQLTKGELGYITEQLIKRREFVKTKANT